MQQLGGDAAFLPMGDKLIQLMTPFVNYDGRLDAIAAAAAVSVPAICLARRSGKIPGPAAWAIVLLLIAFLAAPYAWKGTYGLDTRFAVMLGFMLFAGFVPADCPPGFRFAATIVLGSLFVARMALLTTAWAEHRADLSDMRTVLARLKPGDAVYVAEAGTSEAAAYWQTNPRWRLLSDGTRTDEHLAALALIEHRAYWPFEFDNPSQQPIETREPYQDLALRVDHMPTRTEAATADVCGFDYVLLMDADAVPGLPMQRYRLLVRSGFAALYTITQCRGQE